MSARGRGVKRGPVRLNVARVVSKQEAQITNTNNGGVYEDMMLFVKDQPVTPRKRGRPKKCMSVNTLPEKSCTKIIYVPTSKKCSRQTVPMLIQNRPYQQNRGANGGSYHKIAQCIIQSTNMQPSDRPVLAVGAHKSTQPDDKINWPEDLKQLVDKWDTLPESNLREVVKWLQTPLNTPENPQIVTNIHSMVEEGEESVDQFGLWLLEQSSVGREPPKVIPPKVVVETQPNPLQHCSQWSSMVDNQGFRET